MDKREALKSMLNNFINDKPEEASIDLHNYLTTKMREVAGLGTDVAAETTGDEPPAGDEGEATGATE
jgi:hypothetical protein